MIRLLSLLIGFAAHAIALPLLGLAHITPRRNGRHRAAGRPRLGRRTPGRRRGDAYVGIDELMGRDD